jgi:hypothetical protein
MRMEDEILNRHVQPAATPGGEIRPQAFSRQVMSPMADPKQTGGPDAGAGLRGTLIKQANKAMSQAHLPYEQDMRAAADQFQVPYEALYGILNQESRFNPNARNPKSTAKGMGQFIDSTAKSMGLTDPFNAKDSIFATARYLKDNLAYHKGDLNLAIASHFTGPSKANSPEGLSYAQQISKKMPGDAADIYARSPSGRVSGVSTAMPERDLRQQHMNIANMSLEDRNAMLDTMSSGSRPIQTLRGNKEGWYNPAQSREFGTLAEAITGVGGTPSYAGEDTRRNALDQVREQAKGVISTQDNAAKIDMEKATKIFDMNKELLAARTGTADSGGLDQAISDQVKKKAKGNAAFPLGQQHPQFGGYVDEFGTPNRFLNDDDEDLTGM